MNKSTKIVVLRGRELMYTGIFVVLGIDIWREKDRNYLISIFSSLVALVALVITLFE